MVLFIVSLSFPSLQQQDVIDLSLLSKQAKYVPSCGFFFFLYEIETTSSVFEMGERVRGVSFFRSRRPRKCISILLLNIHGWVGTVAKLGQAVSYMLCR